MKYKLGEVCSRLSSGKGISAKFINETGTFPVYGGNGLRGYSEKSNFKGECAIIGRQGAFCGNVRYFSGEAYMTEHAIVACANEKHSTRYLSYLLELMKLGRLSAQSAQPGLSVKMLAQQEIDMPSLEQQEKIVSILSALEEKININMKINKNLEQQANVLYQSFFSPNSGIQGKAVTLDKYCSIFTGKKNANASIDGGKYKFFTCAPDTLQINSYIYDGNAIIVSGNGAYTGRTRFYSGRFDLYQRTYACTLLDGVNPNYIFPLYWFVKLELSKKIMGGTRGSAIPYIVMNDLAKFEFVYSDEMFDTYTPIFKSLTESIQANELENEHLSDLRDTLLPQLMSAELDVSEIDL